MSERDRVDATPTANAWITTIGAICDEYGGEVQTGPFGSQLHASDYSDEGTPVVMPQDMVDGRITCARVARVGRNHVERLRQHTLRTGDVVFSRRGDVSRFAVVTEAEQGWLCGTGSIRIRLKCPGISIDYARHYLRQPAVGKWLEHHAKGVTMPNLNTSVVRALPFVCPPLSEQRRIAEVLDRAEAVQSKRRVALEQLELLVQSIFSEMFGSTFANPYNFPRRPLGELTDCLDRRRRPVKEADRRPGEVPYYGANGQQGWIDAALFDEPLVLVAEDGGYFDQPERGVAYRIDGPAWVNNHAHVLRPKRGVLEIEYLHRALRHFDFTPYITGTTRAKLTQAQMNAAEIILPPMALQREFASRVARVERLKSVGRASLSMLDSLFSSLQHRAFCGEL